MSRVTLAINLRPLYPGQIGGLEMYVRNLLKQWISGPEDRRISWILFTNSTNHESFGHLTGPCRRILLPNDEFEGALWDHLCKLRPDLYFCPLLTLEPPNPPVPAAVTIPDLQHEFFPEFFSEKQLRWRRQHYPQSGHRAVCVFTLSEFSKATLVERLGLVPKKVFAIYLDVHEVFGRSPNPKDFLQVRQKYNLPKEYLFYPANLWPHKNHETLFQAFALVCPKFPQLSLVLTGQPEQRQQSLNKLAGELGISSRIHHVGYVEIEELPCLYRAATALVFPSLFEGFGLPIVEAFCCECPVICSNTTSCPEVAGKAALLVNPLDPEEIAAAVEQICQDESTRKRLVKAGKNIAHRFLAHNQAETTLERLLEVAVSQNTTEVSSQELPRISVVTPSLNQGEFIRETVESVFSQEYPNLEYRVVDGGSTDETISILKSYAPRLLWTSEEDAGQADAINKGFDRSTGEIISYLNSDDTYLPGTLQYVGGFFASHPEVDVVYGDGYYVDRKGEILEPYRTREFDWGTFAHECYICQPTVFFRRSILDQVGWFDKKLQLCMDYDFWIRLFRTHPPVLLPRFLATSRMYPENKSLSERSRVHREIIQTVRKHYGYVPYSWTLGFANYLWHRNDQYYDPQPTTWSVVILSLAMMLWYNRFAPRYLWQWLKFGMRSELLKNLRRIKAGI